MAASTGGLKVPSPPSSSSRASLQSGRSGRGKGHSTLRTVITSPPWAQDEPPSPTDETDHCTTSRHPSDSRPSDVASYQSSAPPGSVAHVSRWWTFARPRPWAHGQQDFMPPAEGEGAHHSLGAMKRASIFKDRSMSWLPTSHHHRSQDVSNVSPTFSKGFGSHRSALKENRSNWGLTIEVPAPPVPFTMPHSRTPGWDSPWSPRAARNGHHHAQDTFEHDDDDDDDDSHEKSARKKRLRTFILTNSYVPLLFRFINITFTTAALGVAIRIRLTELHNGIMGAVGSSPTLVIIFAPLTLVHVMVAIYLEYFGRPLGLWRTSSKLAHTLIEVLFICAWSAALSLSFDNFFTSLVPCAAPSSIAWYNRLPRPQSPMMDLGRHEGGVGDRVCDDQAALISLVGVGLVMYCINLIISLFRIFEKVKYHPGAHTVA
ncbi:hypothetical protein PILCRDRAFT_817350 [Piloderma croceum F 1598]|uniref:Uncharacterized protein n=1 Tax=Piloderma croceum (strain F 1598) TaxID=765440 RepID=A0A0C3G3Y8_PILCF|nr:hypothetical protein PILCRDRAFT_817350 [Piloderma croceum F 1598]